MMHEQHWIYSQEGVKRRERDARRLLEMMGAIFNYPF